jgi:hypothetical protein
LGRNNQSFFQAVDSKFNIRNVMVGPFDLEAGTFANGHTQHDNAPALCDRFPVEVLERIKRNG